MDSNWFQDEEKFQVLTKVIRDSALGGSAERSDLAETEMQICEEGVEEGVIKKRAEVVCDGFDCDRTYSVERIPKKCICGNHIDEQEPDVVDFSVPNYADILMDILGDTVAEYEVVYSTALDMNDVRVTDLHSSALDESNYLHISPFFEFESAFSIFPGYNDIFLDWYALPEIISNPEEVVDDINNFLGASEINCADLAEGNVHEVFYNGPGSPGPQIGSRTSWYKLFDKVDTHEEANELTEKQFGHSYTELFERLGIECLHTLFPHAITMHCGGKHKPDGFVHLVHEGTKQSYLFESKCSKNDYKLSKELDKATRYVNDFLADIEPREDYNLNGYIFFANTFKENTISDDIEVFNRRIKRHYPSRELDIICIDSTMAQEAVSRVSNLYREEPARTYRIYENSDWYVKAIDFLTEYTANYQEDPTHFRREVINVLKAMGNKKSSPEEKLQEGFSPSMTKDEWRTEARKLHEAES
jgi:hypothetical protein